MIGRHQQLINVRFQLKTGNRHPHPITGNQTIQKAFTQLPLSASSGVVSDHGAVTL